MRGTTKRTTAGLLEIGTKKEARITMGVGIVMVGIVVATGGLGFGGRAGGAELIGKRLKSRGDRARTTLLDPLLLQLCAVKDAGTMREETQEERIYGGPGMER
jgi:hypothetical protein